MEAAVPNPEIALMLATALNNPRLVTLAAEDLRRTGRTLERDYLALPSPKPRLSYYFDPDYYLAHNEDIARAGIDPYLHFLQHGLAEGRNPHPLIDLHHMATQFEGAPVAPWTAESLAAALRGNTVDPHPEFDVAYYLEQNRDVRDEGLPALEHYIGHGAGEGRAPNPVFLPDWYIEANPDLPRDRYQAFVHYLFHGAAEGRVPGPVSITPYPPAASPAQTVGAPEPASEVGTVAPAVQGHLDDTRDHEAHGWAFSPDSPASRLEVEVMSDGQVVGMGVADRFRSDLQEAGMGDGHHAFVIRLSKCLRDGRRHRLRARVCGHSALLPGEPVVCIADSTPSPFDLIPLDVTLEIAAESLPQAIGEHWHVAMARACLQLETGDWKGGLAAWDAFSAEWPDAPIVLAKQAEAHLGLGEIEVALNLFQGALESGEPSDWWLLGLGNAKRLLGQWQEAATAYASGLALAPDNAFLQARSFQVLVHDCLMEARGMLADGRVQEALDLISPLMLRQPGDKAVEELVAQAHDAIRGPRSDVMPAGLKQAQHALDLLESVMSQLEREQTT